MIFIDFLPQVIKKRFVRKQQQLKRSTTTKMLKKYKKILKKIRMVFAKAYNPISLALIYWIFFYLFFL